MCARGWVCLCINDGANVFHTGAFQLMMENALSPLKCECGGHRQCFSTRLQSVLQDSHTKHVHFGAKPASPLMDFIYLNRGNLRCFYHEHKFVVRMTVFSGKLIA